MPNTDVITEKVYCHDPSQNLATMANLFNNRWDPATVMALKDNNKMDPFTLLFILLLTGGNFGWNNRGGFYQDADLSRQIQTLTDTTNTNNTNQMILGAINGNRDALGQLAQTFNTDINAIQQAVGNIRSAIDQVAGAIGFTGEKVISEARLGNSNIMAKISECCCATQKAILEGNYQNQLATERQTNTLASQMAANHAADQLKSCEYHGQMMSRIDQLANGITQGFSATAYESSKNAAAIMKNQDENTQRILDKMCDNSQQALRDQLAEKDRQLLAANIVAQMKKEGCGCGCGC